MSWLAIDIGGANLKAADGHEWATIVPFELWRNPAGLSAALQRLLRSAPAADGVAVTMTGELCDCFPTKADGVQHILTAVEHVAAGREMKVYLVDGRLVTIAEARQQTHLAAASNWRALAEFAGRFVSARAAILIDIGSTTTDIIPLIDTKPAPQGFRDTDRLISGELVYTGVGRTPICAITPWLPWRNERCPVAAEVFATAADAYVLLNQLPDREDFTDTADGRSLTKELSRARLARMICAESPTFSAADADHAAECIRDAQLAQISRGVEKVAAKLPLRPSALVVSGSGEFLAREIARRAFPEASVVSLTEELGPAASIAAPAHALAVLACENASTSTNPLPDKS